MAYTYSDYITLTDTVAREARLRLFIQEITNAVTASVTKGASSRSTAELKAMRSDLMAELDKLVAVNKQASGSRATYARVGRA